VILRNGDKDIVPPKFDNEGNPTNNEEGSKSGASTGLTLEELMRRVEKLTAKNKKLRAKAKGRKTKGSSSLSEEEYLKRMSPKREKRKRNHDKPSYNSMSFNYNNMSSSTAYTSIPVNKAPYFDGTSYNQWKHCIRNYLYSISLEV
jgi:hypothetical protein